MIGFTGSTFDRADQLRTKPDDVAALAGTLSARLLVLEGLDPVLDETGHLTWRMVAEADPAGELILLGLEDGKARFAELPSGEKPRSAGAFSLFRALDSMPADQASTYAAARSLIDWHARYGFCANCASPTEFARAGWGRTCPACRAEHFPRVEPVVIMLAEHEGRVLVGRQPRYPARRYSALAGFVEVGESVEEAVTRELHEEAGVRALSVDYVASQPWPFPSSLMMACLASVEDDALTIDTTELEDAFWVDAEGVRAALTGDEGAPFLGPPPYAIAHSLFRAWLARQS